MMTYSLKLRLLVNICIISQTQHNVYFQNTQNDLCIFLFSEKIKIALFLFEIII